jgi:hypothetical protein
MLFRATLVAASIATAAIGSPSLAGAAPAGSSPSYLDGYNSEHTFYSDPRNRNFLKNEMQQGYDTGNVCRLEMGGGPQPVNPNDWMRGCIDALHDLGFKP